MMLPDDQLTVLLAVKDRPAFTMRWMAYAEACALPFNVFVADGGTGDRVETLLKDRARFRRVAYDYVRYPPDRSYTADYWAKIADALSRIETPLVALADDDDLFVVNGVRRAAEFLLAHDDYASCGGQCAVFWVTDPIEGDAGVYGRRVQWKCSRDTRSLDGGTARERIRRHSLRATHPVYYHVRRTADLRRHVAALRAANLSDPFLIERLLFFLTASAGRIRQLDCVYIARQWNAPGSAGLAHQARHGDWLDRMLVPTWSRDFEQFVQVAAAALAERDGLPTGEAARAVVELYRLWAAPQLLGDILTEPTIAAGMPLRLALAQRLLSRPAASVVRRAARLIYRAVPWISVDLVHGLGWKARPVAGAAAALKPIHDFLSSTCTTSPAATRTAPSPSSVPADTSALL